MEISLAKRAPIDELYAKLECTLCRSDELVLVQTQHVIKCDQRGYGRFTDANRSDFVGLHEHDFERALREQSRQRRGGHPAGSSPADDNDLANGVVRHPAHPARVSGSRKRPR